VQPSGGLVGLGMPFGVLIPKDEQHGAHEEVQLDRQASDDGVREGGYSVGSHL